MRLTLLPLPQTNQMEFYYQRYNIVTPLHNLRQTPWYKQMLTLIHDEHWEKSPIDQGLAEIEYLLENRNYDLEGAVKAVQELLIVSARVISKRNKRRPSSLQQACFPLGLSL